jgi:WD40 repeat protein
MLVGSIKRWANAPLLLSVNRGYIEADRRDLVLVIREPAYNCCSFVHGRVECVAFAKWNVSHVYNLESGDLILELGTDIAGFRSIVTTSEGRGSTEEVLGYVVDGVWLIAGNDDGSGHMWVVETGRWVAKLHPTVCPHDSFSAGVSVAPDRRRVVRFTYPQYHINDNRNPEKGGLHVWDLSFDGTQERYEYVHRCNSSLGFEVASVALLHQDRSKRSSVEQCSSRAVRFERSLPSKMQS